MLSTTNLVVRHLFNFFFSFASFVIFMLYFDLNLFATFFLMIGIPAVTYSISNKVIHAIQIRKRAKELNFTTDEYKMINKYLTQAREQISKLSTGYIRVRSIKSFRVLNDMVKISRRIVNIVQTNPKKFYLVEDFFYSHLPSAVELTDKYAILTKEKMKDIDIQLALEETRVILKGLSDSMEQDLKDVLKTDLEHLRIELDFAKMEQEKRKARIE